MTRSTNALPNATQHYTTQYLTLHHTTLHHIMQHHANSNYSYNHAYAALHYTTLHLNTLHYTSLPSMALQSLHNQNATATALHYLHYTNYTTPTTVHHSYNQLQLQRRNTTLHPAVVGEVTHQVTTATITTPITFRSTSGFDLPFLIHTSQALL